MIVTETDAKPRSQTPLIEGRFMRCPRCKTQRDILDFQRFGEIEEFAQDTAPIYRCPKARGGCSWIFAPADHVVLSAINPPALDLIGEE